MFNEPLLKTDPNQICPFRIRHEDIGPYRVVSHHKNLWYALLRHENYTPEFPRSFLLDDHVWRVTRDNPEGYPPIGSLCYVSYCLPLMRENRKRKKSRWREDKGFFYLVMPEKGQAKQLETIIMSHYNQVQV